MQYFRDAIGIVKANRENRIFPVIEIIKVRLLWQSLWRVKPLSEVPNNPIKSNDRSEKTRANINIKDVSETIPV